MALGSSAPEILLSVIETVQNLGKPPGELGPSTIVGSAAFNLLVISAISVIAVNGPPKRIYDLGVFAITALSSLFAYAWLFFVLSIWTPGEVTIWEAFITLGFFFILVLSAFIADKINACVKRKQEGPAGVTARGGNLDIDDFIELINAKKEDLDAKNQTKHDEIQKFYKKYFEDRDPATLSRQEIEEKLAPSHGIHERIKFRHGVGDLLNGRNTNGVQLQKNQKYKKEMQLAENLANQNWIKMNPMFGFRCLHYNISEAIGKLKVVIVNKQYEFDGELEVGVRTVDGTAVDGDDFTHVDEVLKFFSGEDREKSIEIEIINNDCYEENEDFFIELYDPENGEKLEGEDAQCKVTIIDDDQPGMVGFEKRTIIADPKDIFAKIKVHRMNGADGKISVDFETGVPEDLNAAAKPGVDFEAVKGQIEFGAGETEKEVIIKILDTGEDRDDVFQVTLSNPTGGATLSKKTVCMVEIKGSSLEVQRAKGLEEIIKEMQKDKKIGWLEQFKQAVILSPQIDDDGEIDDITYLEAFLHFLSIGWKVVFAIIPPARYLGGWFTFVVALAFIGVVTAIVGEIASLFGCVIGLKQAVTAISFVALGTSLPDTFASYAAASQSKHADAAIGNITGSNCVNVFLGLGLPWVIASIYYTAKDEIFEVPADGLSFSVTLFIITSTLCLLTLVIRRCTVKGELGGNVVVKWLTFCFFIFLWLVYLILSALKIYDVIPGF